MIFVTSAEHRASVVAPIPVPGSGPRAGAKDAEYSGGVTVVPSPQLR